MPPSEPTNQLKIINSKIRKDLKICILIKNINIDISDGYFLSFSAHNKYPGDNENDKTTNKNIVRKKAAKNI